MNTFKSNHLLYKLKNLYSNYAHMCLEIYRFDSVCDITQFLLLKLQTRPEYLLVYLTTEWSLNIFTMSATYILKTTCTMSTGFTCCQYWDSLCENVRAKCWVCRAFLPVLTEVNHPSATRQELEGFPECISALIHTRTYVHYPQYKHGIPLAKLVRNIIFRI